MSLAAAINSGPTKVIITLVRFHILFDKPPNLPFHNWYWILTRNYEQLFILINLDIAIKKLS
jgi:hypothetical protein